MNGWNVGKQKVIIWCDLVIISFQLKQQVDKKRSKMARIEWAMWANEQGVASAFGNENWQLIIIFSFENLVLLKF